MLNIIIQYRFYIFLIVGLGFIVPLSYATDSSKNSQGLGFHFSYSAPLPSTPDIRFLGGTTNLQEGNGYYSGSAKATVTSNVGQNYNYQAAKIQIKRTGSNPITLDLNFCFSTDTACSTYFSPGNTKHAVHFDGGPSTWHLNVQTVYTVKHVFAGNYTGTVTLTFTPPT